MTYRSKLFEMFEICFYFGGRLTASEQRGEKLNFELNRSSSEVHRLQVLVSLWELLVIDAVIILVCWLLGR